MLARIRDRNIWLINLTILLVGLASGMAISMLALFLDERGYHKDDIGSLASVFALGIALSAVLMAGLVRRFSAKAMLVASLFLYASTLAAFPSAARRYWLIALDRLLDGAAAAGIWVACETILLQRAPKQDKAFVTGLYATAIAIGYVVGPFTARAIVAIHSKTAAFYLAAAALLATGVLVWWRLDAAGQGRQLEAGEVEVACADNGGDVAQTPAATLAWRIKTSLFGTFAYGYFQASVVLFLPLFLIAQKGISRDQTIVIPGFFAVGMLLFVVPMGRLGDRFGHLSVMRLLAVVGGLTTLGFVVLEQFWWMCVAVTIAGATLASISPLSLALQGVILKQGDYARGISIYNGFYALGMLLGPPLSSLLFVAYGGAAMLYHLAALWAAFVLFSLGFANDDPLARRRLAAPRR